MKQLMKQLVVVNKARGFNVLFCFFFVLLTRFKKKEKKTRFFFLN